jgi:acyl carrier protein
MRRCDGPDSPVPVQPQERPIAPARTDPRMGDLPPMSALANHPQLIADRVKQIVSEEANDLPVFDIAIDAQLQAHLGLNSLDRVTILIRLEDEFEIHFSDGDFARLSEHTTTVDDLAKQVERDLVQKG